MEGVKESPAAAPAPGAEDADGEDVTAEKMVGDETGEMDTVIDYRTFRRWELTA